MGEGSLLGEGFLFSLVLDGAGGGGGVSPRSDWWSTRERPLWLSLACAEAAAPAPEGGTGLALGMMYPAGTVSARGTSPPGGVPDL